MKHLVFLVTAQNLETAPLEIPDDFPVPYYALRVENSPELMRVYLPGSNPPPVVITEESE